MLLLEPEQLCLASNVSQFRQAFITVALLSQGMQDHLGVKSGNWEFARPSWTKHQNEAETSDDPVHDE